MNSPQRTACFAKGMHNYCDVPGSPCLSQTGPVVGPYFSIFGSLTEVVIVRCRTRHKWTDNWTNRELAVLSFGRLWTAFAKQLHVYSWNVVILPDNYLWCCGADFIFLYDLISKENNTRRYSCQHLHCEGKLVDLANVVGFFSHFHIFFSH